MSLKCWFLVLEKHPVYPVEMSENQVVFWRFQWVWLYKWNTGMDWVNVLSELKMHSVTENPSRHLHVES